MNEQDRGDAFPQADNISHERPTNNVFEAVITISAVNCAGLTQG